MSTLLVSAAVIFEGDKVLLTQRPGGTHLENHWEFPGGKVEAGESPQAALTRELREELGIETRVGDILEVTFWRYPKRDVLLMFFRAERLDFTAPLQHLGVADHAWVTVGELDAYTLPPADGDVLARVRRLLNDAR